MNSSGVPFPDVTRNLIQVKRSPVSQIFAAGIIAIFLLVEVFGGPEAVYGLYRNLGLSREGVFAGKLWQPLTYGLLHGGLFHVLLNAAFVLLIGSRIEQVTGRSGMARIVALGVLGGGIAHLVVGAGLLVGLSGGCMALLIFLTTISPESRMFPLPVSGRSLGIGILIAELILALIDPALGLPGLSSAGRFLSDQGMGPWFLLGHACHFGGGVAGWLCGRWMLRPRVSLGSLRRQRQRRESRFS